MKTLEISSKEDKNGRRHFKAILYRILPDDCIDEVNQVGTMYNENGITWIREYCEKALPSIEGTFLRCEFLDDERTEIYGHGLTDIIDGEPVFEDAVTIGVFTKGYIRDIETEDGVITACIGEGEIDSQCYHNFIEKLEDEIAKGNYPSGSVEIKNTKDNDAIIYKYGYKDKGRIPMEFIHSGYALLGVAPADNSAKLIELNEKQKEDNNMTDAEIKAVVVQAVNELASHESEINQCKEDCDTKVAELNAQIQTITTEKNEAVSKVEKLQSALDAAQAKCADLEQKYTEVCESQKELQEKLDVANAKERIGELNAAIADFTEEEKAYAKAEIEAFTADPISSEINSVVNKIWEGIGKASKTEKKTSEQNSKVEDIFSVIEDSSNNDDLNIF